MSRTVFRGFFVSLFIFSLLLPGFAQQPVQLPAGIVRVTSVEGITEYRLDNGLRVLLFPDQTKQTITVNVTYLVGSKHENYGETGMAHLLEHLVFKGTPRHPNIPQELTSRGARPNGTTWTDRTNYFETFAATDDNLEWALDLEADRMVNSFIAKKDLESEFSVVRNELESGENNPFRVLFQRTMSVAYDWHNYGKSTIGARSDVENVPIDRLQAFYRRYYQPDNAVLLVAGKFDEAKTLGLVKKHFGAIPKPERTISPNYTVEPTQDGERMVTVRRVGDIQLVIAGYHIPPGSHPDAAAVAVVTNVLTTAPSGRLYKNLVDSKLATSVLGLNFQFKEPGYLMLGAELPKTGNIDAVRETLVETVETLAKTPPTTEEVERAKTQFLKDIDLTLNDPNRVGLGLSEYIAQGDWRLFFINRDRIKNVTPDDAKRVTAAYLKQSNRTVAKFIPTEKPDRAEVPGVSDKEILALVSDYKGGQAIAQGEAFDPTHENIESRTTRPTAGGVKMALLPKKNRGETVFANLNLRFGSADTLINKATAGSFAGQMLMRGTTKRSRQQIQDDFNRLKARVFVFGSASNAAAQIETTRENLPEVMRLVAEILREPAFSETEFEILKRESLTGLENQRSEPTSIAINAMSKHFNRYPKGDPRYARGLDEQIAETQAVTLDEVKAFHKEFYGASDGTLAMVGDFDSNEVAKMAGGLFGDWKSPKPFQRLVFEHFEIPSVSQSFEAPDKANAFFFARLNIKMRDDHPDQPALTLGSYIFGGGFLNSRLATRIRQKEGLSYGVGSFLNVPALDEAGSFVANAIYAPENADKLEAAFRDEIRKVLTDGFTAEELDGAKKGWLLGRQVSRANDNELANGLAQALYLGRTYKESKELEQKVAGLTVEQVNTAMKKHLTPDKISIFKAGDFAKAKSKAMP